MMGGCIDVPNWCFGESDGSPVPGLGFIGWWWIG